MIFGVIVLRLRSGMGEESENNCAFPEAVSRSSTTATPSYFEATFEGLEGLSI